MLTWGAVGGLFLGMLLPTLSEPPPTSPALMPLATPTSAATLAESSPAVPSPAAPMPSPTATAAFAVAQPAPIDFAVAGRAGAWLVRVERGPTIGSGVVVAADGLIVTSEQVVEGHSPIRVFLPGGQSVFAEILFENPDADLVLLAVQMATPAVARMVAATGAGQPVLVVGVGAGQGDPPVVARATVVDVRPDRQASISYRGSDAIDAMKAAGSLLLNAASDVVGIATRPGQAGAVPAERVLAFVHDGQADWRALSRGPVEPAGPVRPNLVDESVDPSVAEPGTSLTLTYEVVNPAATGLTVLLGASVRPTSGRAWIDDPAHDAQVIVEPGRSAYRREFRLPEAAREGSYEVAWSLLSPDKSASYAYVTRRGVVRLEPAAPTDGRGRATGAP